jgi:hypothetical protein
MQSHSQLTLPYFSVESLAYAWTSTANKGARRQSETIIGDLDRAGVPHVILEPVLGAMPSGRNRNG